MPIPAEKKKALIEKMGFPGDLLDTIEQINDSTRKEAADTGLEKKETAATEVGTDTAAVQTTTPVETPAAETPKTPAAEEETTTEGQPIEGATARDIISAVAEVLEPIAKQVKMQGEIIQAQSALIEAINKEMTSLKKDDEQKVKETIAQTPMASLSALLTSRVIGNQATQVGKDDELAKSKPKETQPAPASQPTVVPFLNSMIMGSEKR